MHRDGKGREGIEAEQIHHVGAWQTLIGKIGTHATHLFRQFDTRGGGEKRTELKMGFFRSTVQTQNSKVVQGTWLFF